MKRGWTVLFLVGIAAAMLPVRMQAQVSAYGEFSAVRMTNLVNTTYMYGATTGLVMDGPTFFHHMTLSADIQGRFVSGANKTMDGINVGPRFSIPMHHHRLTPYAEVLVGFARYSEPNVTATTDSTFQVNEGIEKAITPRLDAVVDYSYSQFYWNGGEYNPKTFSGGLVYHLGKR